MSKKNGLFMLAVGAAGGYLAAKYGKQFVSTVKSSFDKQPIEDLVEEIKKSVKQGADEIKKSVEDICSEIEKSYFDYPDMTGYCDDPSDYADEEMNTPKSESTYFKIPVEGVESEKKEEEVKEEELPPLDVKVSENPEEVRKAAVENLAEAEKAIEEELKPTESPAQILKAKRAKGKTKKATAEAKVEEKVEEKSEVVEDPKAE